MTSQLITWGRVRRRFHSLVLNTTAAQAPALALYRQFGFHELGRSYLGSYELVWMERMIHDPRR